VFLTTLGLYLQGVLLFYLAFHGGNAAVLAVGALSELLRPLALLLAFRSVGWQSDWCWCCFAPPAQEANAYLQMSSSGTSSTGVDDDI